MIDDRLTMIQAAQLVGCDKSTIWRAIQRGDIPSELVKTPFNRALYFVNRADVEKWNATRKVREVKAEK